MEEVRKEQLDADQDQEQERDRFNWEEGDVTIYNSVEDMLRDQAKRYDSVEYIEPGKRPRKIK